MTFSEKMFDSIDEFLKLYFEESISLGRSIYDDYKTVKDMM